MYQSVKFRASRVNKDLAHRTFQETKRIWEDRCDTWMKVGMRLRGIPITDWITHCCTSPKITFKSNFRIFCHIHVMQQRHALQTEDVFLDILTKTGWWICRPEFYRFSLWFHWKFRKKKTKTKTKTIAHCLLLKYIKQYIILQKLFHEIVLYAFLLV